MTDNAYPWETGDILTAAALNAAVAAGTSSQWRTGAGVPADATGKDGDMWLNTTTGDVYQRQSGVYVLVADISGPAGSAGPAGPAGSQGSPGPPGGGVSSVGTSGAGIAGGPITTSGVLTVTWNGPAVNALGTGLSAAGGTLVAAPPASSITGTLTYAQLPAEVIQVPISFPFSGKPAASAVVNVPMAMGLTCPASLLGTVVYSGTQATANATFTLNRISGGGTTTTAIGTITITPTSKISCTLGGSGATLGGGEVLQMVAPASQDATLSDVGISVLLVRV